MITSPKNNKEIKNKKMQNVNMNVLKKDIDNMKTKNIKIVRPVGINMDHIVMESLQLSDAFSPEKDIDKTQTIENNKTISSPVSPFP